MILKVKKLLLSKEFQKFFVVGFLSFLIDFGLLNFQVYILHFDLTILGLVFVPNLISASVAIAFNFVVQRSWTFNSREKDHAAKEGGKFIIVQIVNLIIFNTLLFGTILHLGMSIPITKIIVIAFQIFASYSFYKYFVFIDKKL